ncbi:ferredoxin [bacterium]|nr:ferredoxin family protein [Chloroflexi bacterium CFX6]RIL10886.1 MAG: ferredoxin [bacterium]
MTYVITELCTREGDCVEVCPVDCIVPGPKDDPQWPLFYIDPDVCIDCGACVPVCPPEAIFPEFEVPEDQQHTTQLNADYFISGPGYYEFDLEEQRRPR